MAVTVRNKSENTVYEYLDYREFLKHMIPSTGPERGMRLKLAQFLNCHTTYISQILTFRTHLSFEYAVLVAEFLGLSAGESQFFMLLVQYGRAGSKKLEAFFMSQIKDVLKKREQIKNRLQISESLSSEVREKFFSSWHYAAIHVLTGIEKTRTIAAISKCLSISQAQVRECLEFLLRAGLVSEQAGRFVMNEARIHLGEESSSVAKHHLNWRLRAMHSLESPQSQEDLHYSGVISLSKEDAKKMRALMLKTAEDAEKIFRPSPPEQSYGFAIDLFQVGNWQF